MSKRCELYERECIHCDECLRCDLNPNKICDNCMKCLGEDDPSIPVTLSKQILYSKKNK